MNAFYFLYGNGNGINSMPFCARLVFSSRHSYAFIAFLVFTTFEFVQATGSSSGCLWFYCCDCWFRTKHTKQTFFG